MKITAPRSRRRCTQPIRRTRWPASEARSSPHVCVRRRSPRKSSTTEVSISMFSASGRGELRGNFVARQICIARPMAYSSARIARRRFRCRRRSACSAPPACWPVPWRASACPRPVPPRARARRRSRAITAACRSGRFAQRRDEQVQRCRRSASPSTLITRRSSPIEKPMPGACTFEPSDSASPSYRPPPSTEFCAPSEPCTTSNVVRM